MKYFKILNLIFIALTYIMKALVMLFCYTVIYPFMCVSDDLRCKVMGAMVFFVGNELLKLNESGLVSSSFYNDTLEKIKEWE